MKTISMTEFNQRVSAVTREAIEQGETIRVTNRGRVVLRLVPEQEGFDDPLESLIASGLASPPTRQHRKIGRRDPVTLSRDLDVIIEEISGDTEI